jgi:hypothetical protein
MTLILSGTNGVSDIDGDASTPAVRGTDANSGIFFGADTVGVSTGGSEKVSVGASAVVVNDGGADVDFRVEGDTNANLLFVDASADKVGIGTDSPAQRLHILGASAASARARVENASGYLMDVYAGVSDGVGLVTGNNMMFFEVNSAERMRIDTSGNVGIGTSSPTHKLQVTGTNGAEVKVTRGTNDFIISLAANAGNPVFIGTVANSPLLLQTNNIERMRIQANGGLSFANTASPGPFNTVLGDRNNHFTGQRSNTVPSGTTSTMLTINFGLNGAAIVRVVDCGTIYTFNYFTNVYEYFITCYNGTVTATLKQSQLGSGAGSYITTSTGSSEFNVIQTADASLAAMHDTAVDILGVAAGNFSHAAMTITMAANN